MAIDEHRTNCIERVATIVAQANDKVEPSLSEPDLRFLFANESDPDGHHIARGKIDVVALLVGHRADEPPND